MVIAGCNVFTGPTCSSEMMDSAVRTKLAIASFDAFWTSPHCRHEDSKDDAVPDVEVRLGRSADNSQS